MLMPCATSSTGSGFDGEVVGAVAAGVCATGGEGGGARVGERGGKALDVCSCAECASLLRVDMAECSSVGGRIGFHDRSLKHLVMIEVSKYSNLVVI